MALCRIQIPFSQNPGDEAQITLSVDFDGPTLLSAVEWVASRLEQSWPSVRAKYNAETRIQVVRGYRVPLTGGPSSEVQEALVDLAGTSFSTPLPPQCAIVTSLETGRPGRSFRGRVFLPAPTVDVLDGAGLLKSSDAGAYAAFMADWFGAINVIGQYQVVVNSRTLGLNTPVTRVNVGTVIDTQRRRRNRIIENRFAVDVSQV